MSMEHFSGLYYELAYSSNLKSEVKILVQYLESTNQKNVMRGLALLLGNRPKRLVSTSLLRELALEVVGFPEWLFQESFEVSGDLSETISILLPAYPNNQSIYLSTIMSEINLLQSADQEEKKQYILNTWKAMDTNARTIFNKIISGRFRTGVSNMSLVKALSIYLKKDESAISHRLLSDWNPGEISFDALFIKDNPADNLSKPYPFLFAKTLDASFEDLGKPTMWAAEWMWNGIRAQLIKRKGEISLWSKEKELITPKFPEVQVFHLCRKGI